MRSNAVLAPASCLDDVEVDFLEMEAIELLANADAPATPVPVREHQVIEIPMQIVIHEFPVGDNWCELLPWKKGITDNKEVNHDCAVG